MKYGKLDVTTYDVTEEVAALKDLKAKGEISDSEYRKRLSKLQRDRLMFIAQTNGAYTPSKKQQKEYYQLLGTLRQAKQQTEAYKQQKAREEFLAELSKAQQEATSPPETDPES